MWLHTPK
jgi:hypothetical protein